MEGTQTLNSTLGLEGNGTVSASPTPDIDSTPVSELPTVYKTYTTGDFLIGLAICVGASVANAAGVNLIKLDHVRAEAGTRKTPWLRPLWLAGMGLYIASQLVGSTLALEFMRAEYVAPLGSTSLIFNFIFAKMLVGTSITRMDIAGTFVVILGVCGVVGFGNLRTTDGHEENLDLEVLKGLWSRGGWIVYFVCLEVVSFTAFWLSRIIDSVWTERQELETRQYQPERAGSAETQLQRFNRIRRTFRHAVKSRIETWSVSKPDIVLRKMSGVAWSVTGGLLAGQTLVFAKSAVKLATAPGNQFAHPLSIFIIVLLGVAAVVQVYCLNKGLEVYDSTLVVPLFFATYTASGFVNSLTYMNQYDNFKDWVFAMVWLSILVLILGVAVLSSKKPETPKASNKEEDVEEGQDIEGRSKEVEEYDLPVLTRRSSVGQHQHEQLRDEDWDEGESDDDALKKGYRASVDTRQRSGSAATSEFGNFIESEPLSSSSADREDKDR